MLVVSEICAGRCGVKGLEREAREGWKGLWADSPRLPIITGEFSSPGAAENRPPEPLGSGG